MFAGRIPSVRSTVGSKNNKRISMPKYELGNSGLRLLHPRILKRSWLTAKNRDISRQNEKPKKSGIFARWVFSAGISIFRSATDQTHGHARLSYAIIYMHTIYKAHHEKLYKFILFFFQFLIVKYPILFFFLFALRFAQRTIGSARRDVFRVFHSSAISSKHKYNTYTRYIDLFSLYN